MIFLLNSRLIILVWFLIALILIQLSLYVIIDLDKPSSSRNNQIGGYQALIFEDSPKYIRYSTSNEYSSTHQRGSDSHDGTVAISSFKDETNKNPIENVAFETILDNYNINNYQTVSVKAKVAIVIMYSGQFWPNWFRTFVLSTYDSLEYFEFLFFVDKNNCPPNIMLPNHIRVIQLDSLELCRRLLTVDETYSYLYSDLSDNKTQEFLDIMRQVISSDPYILVEFKPCIGYILHDYLSKYSHWAFADIDVLYGDLQAFITDSVLDNFDIITFSFGDNYRLYMRGQLTIHRNSDEINSIWRKCRHFTSLFERLIKYKSNNYKHWNFESSEGCYSQAVLKSYENRINVNTDNQFSTSQFFEYSLNSSDSKISNNVSMSQSRVAFIVISGQFSDAYDTDEEIDGKETLLLGNLLVRCFERPIEVNQLLQLQYDSLESMNDHVVNYTGHLKPTYHPYDSNEHINIARVNNDYKCTYWFDPKYETCLDNVSGDSDVFRLRNSALEDKSFQYIAGIKYTR